MAVNNLKLKRMGFFSDFKASLMKGDVLSLATAVIIGGAFGKIISSVVEDVIMPIVGLIIGGVDFTQKFIALDGSNYDTLDGAKEVGAAVITYGNLLQATINFVIIALFVFVILRAAEKMKKKEVIVAAAAVGPTQQELLIQIRDLLKK
jgi:large conductance mechanosensitive channel